MLSNLPATHAKFFDMLDAELDKVETFYTEREEEMHGRVKLLRKQLNELGKHRQLFYVGALLVVDDGYATKLWTARNHPRTQRLIVGPREHIPLSHLRLHQ